MFINWTKLSEEKQYREWKVCTGRRWGWTIGLNNTRTYIQETAVCVQIETFQFTNTFSTVHYYILQHKLLRWVSVRVWVFGYVMFCFILTPLLMCLMFCFSFPPFICFASRPHLFSISLSFPLYSSLCFQLLCQFVCSCLVSPVFLFRFPVSDLHSIFPGLVVLLDSLSLVFFFLIIIIFFVCL